MTTNRAHPTVKPVLPATLACSLLLTAGLRAAVIEARNSGGSGTWGTSGSWLPAGVPNNGNGGNDFNVTIQNATMTRDTAAAVQNLTLSGGNLAGGSGVTVHGSLTATSSFSITGGGALTAQGAAAFGSTGSGTLTVDSSALALSPATTATFRYNTLRLNTGAAFNNAGNFTFHRPGSGVSFIDTTNLPAPGTVTNSGTFTFNPAVGAGSLDVSIPFTSTGTVGVTGGKLTLRGAGTQCSGILNIADFATLEISSGTLSAPLDVTGNGAFGTLTLTSGVTLTGGLTLTSPGNIYLNALPFRLSGGTLLVGGGLSYDGTVTVENATIRVPAGKTVSKGSGNLTLSDNGVLENAGTMSVNSLTGAATSTFTNSGAFDIYNSASVPANFTNTGTITLNNAGERTFGGSSTHTGIFNAGVGSFAFSGTQNFNGAAFSATGAGSLLRFTGTHSFSGTVNCSAEILQQSSTINNTGVLNTSKSLNGSGSFNNTGTVNALASQDNSISFTNNGTFTVAPTSTVNFGNPTQVSFLIGNYVLNGGNWVVNSGATLRLFNAINHNYGDITLNGIGSSVTSKTPSPINLETSLNSNFGALRALNSRGLTLTNAFTNSGTLQLGGGTLTAPSLTNTAVANITGHGTISPAVANAGTIRASGGTLVLAGGVTNAAGTLRSDPGATLELPGAYAGTLINDGFLGFNVSGSQTFNGPFTGTGGLVKSGAGTLTIGTAFSGATTVNGGTLVLGPSGALSSTAELAINSGSVNLNNHVQTTGALSGAGNLALGTTSGGLFTGGNNSSTSFSGVISGTGSLTKEGTGTLTLGGANTWSSDTGLNGGTLKLTGAGRLPSTTTLYINNSSTLDLGGVTQTLAGIGNSTMPAAGNILNGTIQTTAGYCFLKSGTFSGFSGSHAQGRIWIGGDASATVNLNGPNDMVFTTDHHQMIIGYPSVTGPAGTVKLGHPQALAAGTEQAQLFAGTLDLNGQDDVRALDLWLAGGGSSVLINSNAGDTASFNKPLLLTTANSLGGPGRLELGGVISGDKFTKTGAGTLFLSGENTYTGGTTINAGTIELGHDKALGTGPVTINGGGIRAAGSPRDLMQSVLLNGSFILGRLTDFSGPVTLGGNVTITADNPDAYVATQSEFKGVISGSYGLTFTEGTSPIGNIILSGANTYTGPTNITAGRVEIKGNNTASSLTTVSSGATLAGNGATGPVTVQSGGHVDPTGTLTTGNLVLNTGSGVTFYHGDTVAVNGNLTGNAAINIQYLPPGTHTLITYTGTLTGTPVLGTVPSWVDAALSTATPGAIKITVTYINPEYRFNQWAAAASLTGNNALASATPHNDGVTNFLKYAFHMNPAAPDAATMTPNTGTGGLPVATITGNTLRVEFVRRRNNDLLYLPQYSTAPGAAPWTNIWTPPASTVIDSTWERVVYTITLSDPVPQHYFTRVWVTYNDD